jgi:hypothetical protein
MDDKTETGREVATLERGELTIAEVKGNVARVRALLDDVMIGPSKDHPAGVHYGTIPGTPKPTLYQAGAELILMMFRLEAYPVVVDLSTPDKVHYRVQMQIKHQTSGIVLGWGVGECSSDEEKYRWRKVVADGEYDEADPTQRRNVWKKGKDGTSYRVKQVRTHPADVANTILKMAHKRALVSGARGCTAASDVFNQDVEDLSPEMRASIYGDEGALAEPPKPPAAKTAPAPRPPADTNSKGEASETTAPVITPNMKKTILGRATAKGVSEAKILAKFGIALVDDLPRSRINEAMEWLEQQ